MARTTRNTKYKGELKKQSHVELSRPDNQLQDEIESGMFEWQRMQDTEMLNEEKQLTWWSHHSSTVDGNEM